MANIVDIEGIGPAYGEKLSAHGITTTDRLLEAGASKKGREELAAGTGISESLILEWVNHADLYRIKGVGSEYADLLEAAGVDTVPELAQRNSSNLAVRLAEVNEAKSLVRRVPTESEVEDWISQAKALDQVITH
jgi:predicted flap endonuclease-1-like 5' DNA nuclease